MYGFFDVETRNCRVYHKLSKFCIQITKNTEGIWTLDKTFDEKLKEGEKNDGIFDMGNETKRRSSNMYG